ncbi:MAG: hypothetical protein KME32_34120 [Mojavia pulchra JT2-VF2]|uniref:Uncharacterized protein n=1 Tax=Mojavia pulchra JT2-VF2 TaxID=287848 RepID=A0A951UK69_9NOST|nr:hypothetical protein [Mojavia pulchra JT2-VF2]
MFSQAIRLESLGALKCKYTTRFSQPLPDWAIIISQTSDLVELEIDDNHSDFQLFFDGLASEIQPGVIGVKSAVLRSVMVARCSYGGSISVAETSILV